MDTPIYQQLCRELNGGPMSTGDDRTADEKAAWDAGAFTPEEAKDAGMSVEEMNKQRAAQERELGNPLAPPE